MIEDLFDLKDLAARMVASFRPIRLFRKVHAMFATDHTELEVHCIVATSVRPI